MLAIRFSRPVLFAVVSILAALVSSQASAAIFVDIPGIPGESADADHQNQIDARSASGQFELNSCGAFLVTKELDQASPLIIGSVVRGDTFPSIVVEYTTSYGDGGRQVFAAITFNGATITSLSSSPAEDIASPPLEQFSIEASSIEVVYNKFNNDGSSGGTISETVTCGKPKRK